MQDRKRYTVLMPLLSRFHVKKAITSLYMDAEKLYDDIRQNIQCLLNTHTSLLTWSDYFHELDSSLWGYGVGDFSHYQYNNDQSQREFCFSIQKAIERFEPRLMDVQVTLLESDKEITRVLDIRIEAMIKHASMEKEAIFESSLDISTQLFDVKSS